MWNVNRNSYYDQLLINERWSKGITKRPNHLINISRLLLQPSDYIETTSPTQRLYDQAHTWNLKAQVWPAYEYSNQKDLIESGFPVSNEKKCKHDLEWIIENIRTHQNYTTANGKLAHELTNYIDSFGKPEPSTYYGGSIRWHGAYSQCLKVELNDGNLRARYCTGNFRFNSWPEEASFIPETVIRIGLCLPETCDTRSFPKFKDQIEYLAKYELIDRYKRSLSLESMYCLPDERSPIRKIPQSGWIYLSVVGFWTLLIIIASLLHSYFGNPKENLNYESLLQMMAIQTSIKDFVDRKKNQAPKPSETVDLQFLNFIKFIMMIMIIWGHSESVTFYHTQTYEARKLMLTDLVKRLSGGFRCFVDTFFILYGMLVSYKLMRYPRSSFIRAPFWFVFNLRIFLKTIPTFALMFWFCHSVSAYIGHGPGWDYGTGPSLRWSCMNEPWWRSIPYFGNSEATSSPPCNSPAWFSISYTRLALIIPPLTYVLSKLSPLLQIGLVTYLLILSCLNEMIRLTHQQVLGPDGVYAYSGFLVLVIEKFEPSGYQDTFSHLGSVAAGCFAGVVLDRFRECSRKDLPKWLGSTALSIVLLVILSKLFIYPLLYNSELEPPSLLLQAFTLGYHKIAWIFVAIVLIIQMSTAFNESLLASFMSHPFWRSLNHLNLGLYLVHLELITYINQIHEHGAPFNGYTSEIIMIFSFVLLISLIISLYIYIIIQLPLSKLLNLLMENYIGWSYSERFTPVSDRDIH